MKIALLPSTFLPRIGGAEMVVHQLALALTKAGHEVHVITWWGQARVLQADPSWKMPYPVHALPPKLCDLALATRTDHNVVDMIVWLALARLQKKHRFDVWNIHHTYPGAVICGRALKRLGCPVVITSHGSDVQIDEVSRYGDRLNPERNLEIIKAWKLADVIMVINRAMALDVVAAGIAEKKVYQVTNGLDCSRFVSCTPTEIEAMRMRLSLPLDKVILLTVGRNHSKKNFTLIPDVINHMRDLSDQFLWLLVGRENETVRVKAEALGVGKNLQCIDEIGGKGQGGDDRLNLPSPELLMLYAASDMYVLPSRIEGMPLVLMEAMASGLPVITTSAPGCGEFVDHGKNGLVTDLGDLKAMSDAIIALIQSRNRREEMGANARLYARQWDWSLVAKQYEVVYNKAAR